MSAQPSKLLNKSICTVRSISTFANWTSSGGVPQRCSICKQSLNDLCLECQSDLVLVSSPESVNCQVIWGECNHCFHQHCFFRHYIKSKTTCPLCCADWVTTQVGDGPTEKQKEEVRRIESRYRSLIDIHQILNSGQAKVSKVMQTDWSVRVLVENFVIPK